jgi:hypothetical protein
MTLAYEDSKPGLTRTAQWLSGSATDGLSGANAFRVGNTGRDMMQSGDGDCINL